MAFIRPFPALRPERELAAKIAALPYDVVDSREAREMVQNNEYSFLRIDRAEINFPEPTDPHDPKVYPQAAQIFHRMITKKQFVQDQTKNFYIYRQIMAGRAQTGLVAVASLDDYQQNIIRKHELTRPEKEEDRIKHIQALQAQSGPIFQTYRDQGEVSAILENWAHSHQAEYHFTSHDVEQLVWILDCPRTIDKIERLFRKIDRLYIADGHHRSAAAVRVGLQKRRENPGYSPEAPFNFFLSVLFPASELKIWPYHRVVRDLNNHSPQKFLELIQKSFNLETAPQSPYQPQQKHCFGLYLADQWHKLTHKPQLLNNEDFVKSLAASILQEHLLDPILKIKDPRSDERIDFVGGIRGLKELERRLKTDMKVAFSLCPTSIEEVLQVADSNEVMPPKSTWFEPKLLSGLFIHRLN